MTTTQEYPNTIEALRIFDEGRPEFHRAFMAVKTNEEVMALLETEKQDEIKVQTAFHEDTKASNLNSLDNCKMLDIEYIRYASGQPLSPDIISLGRTGFGKLTGETYDDGRPKWKYHSLMGDARVRLLQDAREGRSLPEGLILLGQVSGGNHVPIKAENVAWGSWTGRRR
jgi:hypothetical protein